MPARAGGGAALPTPLTELLRIRHPVILAGMNASSGPRLVASVSNAGGLGVMGGAAFNARQLRELIRECKGMLDDKTAFGVDLLLPQVGGSARKTNHAYTDSKGGLPALLDVIIEEGARLFVSAVGVPPKWAVDRLHAAGILVMNMVGLPSHVEKACGVGVDILCAVGYEAGGHVGEVGSLVLVPQIVDAARGKTSPLHGGPVHVVAGGGVHDGRTLAAVMMLGAQAAWVGTRFLASHESSPVSKREHMKKIVAAKPTDTVRTLIYSGRPLRVFKTPYVQSWEADPARRMEVDRLTKAGVVPVAHDFRTAKKAKRLAGDIGFKDGWSFAKNHRFLMGQCSGAITSVLPAQRILEGMVEDAARLLQGTAGARL